MFKYDVMHVLYKVTHVREASKLNSFSNWVLVQTYWLNRNDLINIRIHTLTKWHFKDGVPKNYIHNQ